MCDLLLYWQVPLGTTIKDMESENILSDLMVDGEECVVAEGGEGGVGNAAFATTYCRRTREYSEGSTGQERVVEMELKTIADVGMVSSGPVCI